MKKLIIAALAIALLLSVANCAVPTTVSEALTEPSRQGDTPKVDAAAPDTAEETTAPDYAALLSFVPDVIPLTFTEETLLREPLPRFDVSVVAEVLETIEFDGFTQVIYASRDELVESSAFVATRSYVDVGGKLYNLSSEETPYDASKLTKTEIGGGEVYAYDVGHGAAYSQRNYVTFGADAVYLVYKIDNAREVDIGSPCVETLSTHGLPMTEQIFVWDFASSTVARSEVLNDVVGCYSIAYLEETRAFVATFALDPNDVTQNVHIPLYFDGESLRRASL